MILLVEQKLLFFRNNCVHPWFATCFVLRQATGKLYHLRLLAECTFFVICKAGREPILLLEDHIDTTGDNQHSN
jgi:hypothetical protein